MGSPATLIGVARTQLGVHESPPYSNRVKYSDWYGMVGPWCAMFVSWCAAMSGNADVIPRHAYTPSGEAWFRARGQAHDPRQARPGDIVYFNFIGRTSHVGIVEAVRPDGLITLEGNTNGGGSRDGGSVMRHFRAWSSQIVCVGRPAYSSTESTGDLMPDIMTQINKALVDHGKQQEVRLAKVIADVNAHTDEVVAGLEAKVRETKRITAALAIHTGMSQVQVTEAAKPAAS